MSDIDQMEEAIRNVAIALGQSVESIRESVQRFADINKQNMGNLINLQRQIMIISKGHGKSYISQYAKFDKIRKRRKR